MARGVVIQSLVGAALWVLGFQAARGAEDAAAPAVEAPPKPPSQSRRETEPPAIVGPSFDDDRRMTATSKRVTHYELAARLDAASHRIEGRGTIAWRNTASRTASELYFHLYLNAFKNSRTVFLRSPFARSRSGGTPKHWGYVDVKALRIREMGGVDVWPGKGSSGSEDPEDETDIRVPLPRAVEPDEAITLEIEWTSQLPEGVERTGYVDDFHLAGQWFPKLARLEPDGTWAHFPFHSQGEFYADFGSYDVTLDTPADMVVGATGSLVGVAVEHGRRRSHYRAEDVHDFAWTAWPGFRERTATVDGVRVRVLYPRGNDRNAEAALSAVRHGLSHYGKAYGRYPYAVLTVVHPPASAPAMGGMEYPTFITTGAPWYTSYGSTFVERETLHELAHQWFYGLVATDEHTWPFLDEGLTTYAESDAMRAFAGAGDGFSAFGLEVGGLAYLRSLAVDGGHDDVIARPAADFVGFQKIGELVYARTGIVLETLARVYGRAGLRKALGRYARRYRFEHPGPKHLVAVVREAMGDEPADFLHTALFEGGWVDFAVSDLRTTPVRPPSGIFDGAMGRETKDARELPDAPAGFTGRVVIHRRGTLRMPVEVELHFADGSRTRRTVDVRERWTSIPTDGEKLVAAVVDPELRVLLDENLSNNAVRRRRALLPRLVERTLYAAELALGVLGP